MSALRPMRCRECDEYIVFLPTSTGKQMPIDADSVDEDDTEFDPKKHVTHFSTCTNAARFRKPKS